MDLLTISLSINDITDCVLFILVLFSWWMCFNRKNRMPHIPIYLSTSLIFNLIGIYLANKYHYNLYLLPLFDLFNFTFWSFYFGTSLHKKVRKFNWIDLLLIFYLVYEIVNLYNRKNFWIIPGASMSNLILFLYLTLAYVKQKNTFDVRHWFIFTVLFSATAFRCLFYLFIEVSVFFKDNLIYIFWIINALVSLLFYCSLTYYQWKIMDRKPK